MSGAAALLIQAHPSLTPGQVKGLLMRSGRPAVDDDGLLAYTVFQQGAGLIDVFAAVQSTDRTPANRGLDVALDLAGLAHYGGPADRDADGAFFLRGLTGDGYMWSDGYLWSDGFLWADDYDWSDSLA